MNLDKDWEASHIRHGDKCGQCGALLCAEKLVTARENYELARNTDRERRRDSSLQFISDPSG